jgi:uncharacterized protein (DUF4415 family)
MLILVFKESDLMRPLKEKVSITLDGDVVEEVKRLAEEDDRSFSQYINRVLRKHVKDKNNIQG